MFFQLLPGLGLSTAGEALGLAVGDGDGVVSGLAVAFAVSRLWISVRTATRPLWSSRGGWDISGLASSW